MFKVYCDHKFIENVGNQEVSPKKQKISKEILCCVSQHEKQHNEFPLLLYYSAPRQAMDIVQREYKKDKTLKPEEVQNIQHWLQSQPHLPKMTDQEIIWFLRSCYSSNEATKITIDNYFTMKTHSSEILRNKDITRKSFQETLGILLFSVLPEKTIEGHSVIFVHFLNKNSDYFHYNEGVKIFDMIVMLDLLKSGTHEGLRCCFDIKDMTFSHLAKIGIISLKKFLYYLQEGMPVRLKGLHFLNISSVMDKLLFLMKPFLKKSVLDMVHLHESVKDMEKFIPVKCLPAEYGGNADSFTVLHDAMRKNISENTDFFNHQDSQVVDETKRPGKPKNANDIFGIEGTFKKLDLD